MISNLDYLLAHLPARMRRDDDVVFFLKRFLSFFGMTLDGFDHALDTFFQKIAPATAPQEFIDWWLYSLFGWAWFPTWFTEARRRVFYAAITKHYAKRGTAIGIKEFLAAFGLRVIIETEPLFWGEATWGEEIWSVNGPLGIMIRLFPEVPAVDEDLEYWSEAFFGEAWIVAPGQSIQRADLDELIRFVWPLGNIIMVEDLQFPGAPSHGMPIGEYGSGEYGSGEYGSGEYGNALPG